MEFVERHYRVLVTALITVLALAQFASIRLETQTFDEGVHLAAGYSYLSQGDYRMNIEHPPLGKILNALPLLLLKPRVGTDLPSWGNGDQYGFGSAFLYQNRVPADTMLLAARSVTILLTLTLAFAVARWTKRWFGAAPALLALGFIAFDPNLIAHGRYITSDLILTLFFFLTISFWTDYLEYGRRAQLVAASASFGLALASKYSAVILVPILALLYLVAMWRKRHMDWKGAIVAGAALYFGAQLVVGLAYVRETARIVEGEASSPSYFVGLRSVREHQAGGHPAWLLGQRSDTGWWYYFPIAFAVKTPSGVLLLALALAAAGIGKLLGKRRWRPDIPFVAFALALPFLVYFGWSLTSRINIGVRHLLPVYPFLYVMLAAAASRARMTLRLAAIALALVAVESVAGYPDYLSFFNTLSGGSANGPNYLLDSNVDWGQDVKKLSHYIDAQGKPPICFAYFGTVDLAYYGLQWKPFPAIDPAEIAAMDCLGAISVNFVRGLYLPPGSYAWLRDREPIAKIGGSIYIYDFRKLAGSNP